MENKQNLTSELGLPVDATEEEIKAAFRDRVSENKMKIDSENVYAASTSLYMNLKSLERRISQLVMYCKLTNRFSVYELSTCLSTIDLHIFTLLTKSEIITPQELSEIRDSCNSINEIYRKSSAVIPNLTIPTYDSRDITDSDRHHSK